MDKKSKVYGVYIDDDTLLDFDSSLPRGKARRQALNEQIQEFVKQAEAKGIKALPKTKELTKKSITVVLEKVIVEKLDGIVGSSQRSAKICEIMREYSKRRKEFEKSTK